MFSTTFTISEQSAGEQHSANTVKVKVNKPKAVHDSVNVKKPTIANDAVVKFKKSTVANTVKIEATKVPYATLTIPLRKPHVVFMFLLALACNFLAFSSINYANIHPHSIRTAYGITLLSYSTLVSIFGMLMGEFWRGRRWEQVDGFLEMFKWLVASGGVVWGVYWVVWEAILWALEG